MSIENNNTFMRLVTHVVNINKLLRNAKLEVLVNYIHSDPFEISVITNKVSLQSNLQIIDQYVKNSEDINALQVDEPWLSQSKSYLKIIGIPYFSHGNSQDRLTSSDVETVLKQNQIFNNIKLAFKLRVIKVSPKLNMSITWINIWDIQSGSKAKGLINWCFNVSKYIVTIRGANMNPGVPRYKNCWKWGHATFSCRIQGSKCIKYNGPHKSENHCEFGWYYKANEKTNTPWLETKKGEPCPHMFKCSNCWRDHQANSNQCPFWRHRFNKEWQQKKYTEIYENRIKLIRSMRSVELQQWFYKTSEYFHKMSKRIHLLSTSYLRLKFNSMSSSSRNLPGPKSVKSPAHQVVKARI